MVMNFDVKIECDIFGDALEVIAENKAYSEAKAKMSARLRDRRYDNIDAFTWVEYRNTEELEERLLRRAVEEHDTAMQQWVYGLTHPSVTTSSTSTQWTASYSDGTTYTVRTP